MGVENEYEMDTKWVHGSYISAAALNLRVFTICITYLILKIPY